MKYKHSLAEDLVSPLWKVERAWLRKPTAWASFIVIIVPMSIVLGAYEGVKWGYKEWFKDL